MKVITPLPGIMSLRNKIIASISLPIFFSGSGLFLESRVLKCIRCVLRLIYLFMCGRSAYLIYTSVQRTGLSITTVSQTQYAVSRFLSFGLLMIRRKEIESLIIDCFHSADQKSLKELFRSITIINVIVAVSLIGGPLTGMPWRDSLPDIIFKTLQTFSAPWVDATSAFYCILLQVLLVHQKLVIRRICPNIQSVREGRRLTCLMNDRFDRLFSYLPFLWFLNGIIEVSFFTMVTATAKSVHETIVNALWIMGSITPPVIVCIVVSNMEASIAKEIDACHNKISQCVRMTASESLLLKTELDQIKLRVTGLSFFELNRSLALSYIGNVITFAALIGTYIKNM